MKIAFISSLFIGDEFKTPDTPVEFEKKSDYDYFLFTNIPKEDFNTSWDIINIDFPEISNSIIKSRIPKFQPWKIDLLNNYDIVIYCDAYWSPVSNTELWDDVINQVIKSEVGIVQSKNPYRDCAYDECDELIKLKKDTESRMEKTIQYLENNSLPVNWGLWRNTFLCINMKNLKVKKLFDIFWEIYEKNEYTHRDQPLYSLACFKSEILPEEVVTNRMDHNLFEMSGKISKHEYD